MCFNYRLSILASVIIYLFLCTACKPTTTKRVQANHLAKPQCIQTQSVCVHKTKVGNFSLLFNVKSVKTEVPFTLYIQYQGPLQLQSVNAYMEGKNMFMGKIPLFFQATPLNKSDNTKTLPYKKQTLSAETMVVACSEPNMQWRVWFTAKLFDKNQQKTITQQFFVDFNSRYD